MTEVAVASNIKTGESVYFIETGYEADLVVHSAPAVTIGTNFYRLTRALIESAFEDTVEGNVFSNKVKLYSEMDAEGKQLADRLIGDKLKDRVLELLGDGYRIGVDSGDAENFSAIVRENIDSIIECAMNSLHEKIALTSEKISKGSASNKSSGRAA